MNRQIKEMAKCCTFYHNGECCLDVTNIGDCDLMCEMFGVFANLESQGYRKQSEVAREIFAEIGKHKQIIADCFQPVYTFKQKEFEELKKKYTEVEQ